MYISADGFENVDFSMQKPHHYHTQLLVWFSLITAPTESKSKFPQQNVFGLQSRTHVIVSSFYILNVF